MDIVADSTVTAGTPWLELLLLVGGALILWGAAALLVFRYLRRSRRLSNLASDDAATEIVRVVGEEAPFAYLMAEEEYRRAPLEIRLFRGGPVTIGRSSECTAVIKDVSISRRHAVIVYKNGHFYLSDSGSRGGTFLIQGEAPPGTSPPRLKASEERLLRDGDLIKFYTFAYRYQEGEATQIPDEGDTR